MSSEDRFLTKGIVLVIIIGVAIRLILGYTLEFTNDVTAWTITITNIDSGNGLYSVAGFYYPPVWGYMLASFAEVIEHLGVDSLGDFFTELLFMMEINEEAIVSTPIFNLCFTIFLMIGDLLCSFMLYWIVMQLTSNRRKARMAFALYFLAVNVIVISSVGAMFDTFSALFTLTCVCLLLKGHDFLAGSMFAMAVLLKFFPAFLIFILVAYVYKKGADRWKTRLAMTILGAGITTLILILPQIVNGEGSMIISALTSRTGAETENIIDLLDKIGMFILYPLALILEILIAIHFVKSKKEDIDGVFIGHLILSAAVIFLYPGTPQYLLLMMPFIIIGAVMFDGRYLRPYVFLIIGSPMTVLEHLPGNLISISFYDGFPSYDVLTHLYDVIYSNGAILHEIVISLSQWLQIIATALTIILSYYVVVN